MLRTPKSCGSAGKPFLGRRLAFLTFWTALGRRFWVDSVRFPAHDRYRQGFRHYYEKDGAYGCDEAKRRQNEEVDRRIFEKVDAVREQRHRADDAGNGKLDPEVGEVQDGDEPDDSP